MTLAASHPQVITDIMSSRPTKSMLGEFRDNLRSKWRFRPDDNLPEFYNTPRIEAWFFATQDGHSAPNGLRLCDEIVKRYGDIFYGVASINDPACIMRQTNRSIMVLSYLIWARLEQYIFAFFCAGVHDSNMHDTSDQNRILQTLLGQKLSSNAVLNLLQDFENEKWAFCPVRFTSDWYLKSIKNFPEGRIFPYCQRKNKHKSNPKGGTSCIYTVLIPEDFASNEMRTYPGTLTVTEESVKYYKLVLKTYKYPNRDFFFNDADVLKWGIKQEGIIRCFGCYARNGSEYSILLNHADSDLDDFYVNHEPPLSKQDIIEKWAMLFPMARVLDTIHNPGGDAFGYHGDIKPDNILVVRKELQLTDFGSARFQAGSPRSRPNVGNRMGAAQKCCSPEAGKSHATAADIWSFGTILSLHATWIIAGRNGLATFENFRKQGNLTTQQKNIDTFHDGIDVLEKVHRWHWKLKEIIKPFDPVSLRVIALIDERLLHPDPEERPTAGELTEQLHQILQDVLNEERRPQSQSAQSVDSADQQALNKAAEDLLVLRGLYHDRMYGRDETQSRQRRAVSEPSTDSSSAISFMPSQRNYSEGCLDLDQSDAASRGSGRLSLAFNHPPMAHAQNPYTHPSGTKTSPPRVLRQPSPLTFSTINYSSTAPYYHGEGSVAEDGPTSLNPRVTTNPVASTQHYEAPTVESSLEFPKTSEENSRRQCKQAVWKSVKNNDSHYIELAMEALKSDSSLARIVDEKSQTPLMVAAKRQNMRMIELLLEPSDKLAKSKRGKTVLHYFLAGLKHKGIKESDVDKILKIIHELGEIARKENDCKENKCEESFLGLAGLVSEDYRLYVVEALIDEGAKLEYIDFATAVRSGHKSIVRCYLKRIKGSIDFIELAKSGAHSDMIALMEETQKAC